MMETVSQFECPHCSWKKIQSLGPMKLISGSSIPLWRPPSKIVSMKEKRFPSKPLRWRPLSVPPTFFSFSRPLSPHSNDMYQHVFLLWGAKSHARWKRCDPHKSIHTSDLDDQLSNSIHKLVLQAVWWQGKWYPSHKFPLYSIQFQLRNMTTLWGSNSRSIHELVGWECED